MMSEDYYVRNAVQEMKDTKRKNVVRFVIYVL